MKLFPNITELHIEDDNLSNGEFNLLEDILDDCTTYKVKFVSIATRRDINPSIDITMIKPRLNVEKLHVKNLSLLGERRERNNCNLLYIQHKFTQLKEFTFKQHVSHNCNNIMSLLHFLCR